LPLPPLDAARALGDRTGMATSTAAKPAKPSELRSTLTFFVKLAVIVWLVRSLVFSAFFIPSESMLPRLLIGDYLFISKWSYGYSRWSFPWVSPPFSGRIFGRLPARGDVVVFRSPHDPVEGDHDVIKRVIGLPGDTVQMRHGQLILDGRPVPKVRIADFTVPLTPNYPAGDGHGSCAPRFQSTAGGVAVCRYPRYRETLPGGRSYEVLDQGQTAADDTEVFAVPAGHVFLMGDNRDDSADSRFPAPDDAMPGQQTGMGFVPLDHLEGKAQISFFSTDGSAQWVKPWTWFTAARPDRIGEGF
jgi:signal peptidase I